MMKNVFNRKSESHQSSNLILNLIICFLGVCIFIIAQGCAQTKLLQGNNTAGAQGDSCGTWTAEEGLFLLDAAGNKQITGKIACSKKAIVFIHGWALGGVPTEFSHSDLWRKAGYNTFVFEWLDLAKGLDPIHVYRTNTTQAAERLVAALKKLGQQVDHLELHLAGHSFGAKVAVEASFKLSKIPSTFNATLKSSDEKPKDTKFSKPKEAVSNGSSNDESNKESESRVANISQSASGLGDSMIQTNTDMFNSPLPQLRLTRLTLLDPALLLDFAKGATICGGEAPHPQAGPFFIEATNLNSRISLVSQSGVAIEAYTTNVAGISSTSIANQVPTMVMLPRCNLFQAGRSLKETHDYVVRDYFSSIADQNPPIEVDSNGKEIGRAFSAATPTSELPARAVRFVLTDKNDIEKPLAEQKYLKEATPKNGLGCGPTSSGGLVCRAVQTF